MKRYGSNPNLKSRTGYIITLGGCPAFWKSKLQSSIALSTTEAEYVALSQSLRLLLPMQELLAKIIEHVDVPPTIRSNESTIKAMVFEDNNSALLLATSQLLVKMMSKRKKQPKDANIRIHCKKLAGYV